MQGLRFDGLAGVNTVATRIVCVTKNKLCLRVPACMHESHFSEKINAACWQLLLCNAQHKPTKLELRRHSAKADFALCSVEACSSFRALRTSFRHRQEKGFLGDFDRCANDSCAISTPAPSSFAEHHLDASVGKPDSAQLAGR